MESVILEENVDENYEPTQAEIDEYAKWLGMQSPADDDLIWIAREGLKAPLPEHWKPLPSLSLPLSLLHQVHIQQLDIAIVSARNQQRPIGMQPAQPESEGVRLVVLVSSGEPLSCEWRRLEIV